MNHHASSISSPHQVLLLSQREGRIFKYLRPPKSSFLLSELFYYCPIIASWIVIQCSTKLHFTLVEHGIYFTRHVQHT